MSISRIERPGTLKEAVYQEIKKQLLSGLLKDEKLFSANKLSESMEVSRTPIREALMQLASEGFLIPVDGRGFRVRKLSMEEIHDFFETRKIIEGYIIEQLAATLSLQDLEILKGYLSEMEACVSGQQAARFLESDRAFHLHLIQCHRNKHLKFIMETARDLISVLGHQAVTRPGRMEEVVKEHRQMVEALERKDAKQAAEALRCHLLQTEQCLVEPLNLAVPA